MKTYGGEEVYLHLFATSVLAVGEWLILGHDVFTAGK
jgi:hypothetical protein